MTLKKTIEIIGNIGTLIFLIYFAISIVLYQTLNGFLDNDYLRYMVYIGSIMIFPKYIYKFAHFNEYRKENIGNLIFLGIILIIILLHLYFNK